MFYSRRKLSKKDRENLAKIKINSLRSFSLLYVPVYLYLQKNEKFLAIKAPFDFFSDEDLNHLQGHDILYVPKFVHQLNEISRRADVVRAFLEAKSSTSLRIHQNPNYVVRLTMAPFELSNNVLKLLAPLWRKTDRDLGIEPFFVAVFINELLGDIPSAILIKSRQIEKEAFEWAILVSSLTVFFALHLGYCDYDFLRALRLGIIKQNVNTYERASHHIEIEEAVNLAMEIVQSSETQSIKANQLSQSPNRVAQKLASRLKRIEEDYPENRPPLTILGERGLIDG